MKIVQFTAPDGELVWIDVHTVSRVMKSHTYDGVIGGSVITFSAGMQVVKETPQTVLLAVTADHDCRQDGGCKAVPLPK
jgi:hypothetical protein